MHKGTTSCTVTLFFIGSLLASMAYAEEYNINPGMWETTSKLEISGMPPEMAAMMQQPPKVQKQCIKDKNHEFNPGDSVKGCTFNTERQSSKKLTWDIKCGEEGGNASGQGEVNFNGNTVSGWFEMNMPQGPNGPIKMNHSFKGKRVGSC